MNFLQKPFVIAHRGASAYAPENTLASFHQAAKLGAKWVEFDVMLAADGTPVVFHDETLERTTNGQGPLSRSTYAQLSNLDAGSWFSPAFAGERVPTLTDVLDALSSFTGGINIEIKARLGAEDETVMRVVRCVQTQFAHLPVWFSSFSPASMDALAQNDTPLPLGCLFHTWDSDWRAFAKAWDCQSIHINHAALTQARVQEVLQAGFPLLCYTVNDKARAEELFAWGVNGVYSDFPDLLTKKDDKRAG